MGKCAAVVIYCGLGILAVVILCALAQAQAACEARGGVYVRGLTSYVCVGDAL